MNRSALPGRQALSPSAHNCQNTKARDGETEPPRAGTQAIWRAARPFATAPALLFLALFGRLFFRADLSRGHAPAGLFNRLTGAR